MATAREGSGIDHTAIGLSPHVPTSVALTKLLEGVPADRVSLPWLIAQLGKRSFGLLLLIVSFLGLAPAISILAMVMLPFPAIQMILGHEAPILPRFLATRSIPTHRFSRWATRAIPFLRHMELFIHPRWHTPFQLTKRVVGVIVLILALTLIAPFPFNIIPTLAIMLISFAYLEEDGILLCISFVMAIFSISVTAGATLEAGRALGWI